MLDSNESSVESLHQPPKSKDMAKTNSRPQHKSGYGDIEWYENPSVAIPYRFKSGHQHQKETHFRESLFLFFYSRGVNKVEVVFFDVCKGGVKAGGERVSLVGVGGQNDRRLVL